MRKRQPAENHAISEKQCFKCGHTKPLDEFYPAINGTGGRTNKCKECTKTYSKAHHQKRKQRQEGAMHVATPRAVGDLSSKDEDFKTVLARLRAKRDKLRGNRGRKAADA